MGESGISALFFNGNLTSGGKFDIIILENKGR